MIVYKKTTCIFSILNRLTKGLLLTITVSGLSIYAKSNPDTYNNLQTEIEISRNRNQPVFQSFPPNFEYNSVRCIFKDSKGYMWFGANDGLIRFDGINLYVYDNDPGNPFSLSHNTINDMVEDKHGNLWIATSDGLNRYNREKDNFIHIENSGEENNPVNFNYINSIYIDHDSLLWIGSFVGIYTYNLLNHHVKLYSHSDGDPYSLSHNLVTCVIADAQNNIWVGTKDGLNLFLAGKEEFRHFFPEPGNPESLSNRNISTLVCDSAGNLWIGTTGGGLNKVIKNKESYSFEHYLSGSGTGSISSNYILSLYADKKGYLWIGTDNGGLNRMKMNTGFVDVFRKIEGDEYSLNSNSIWALYVDDEERIWVGTYNKGINVIDDDYRKFELYQKNIFSKGSLTDDDVTGFAEDSKGKVWVATDGGGICKFDPETRQIIFSIVNSENQSLLVNNSTQAILCDTNDYLWVATWAGGIDRLNNKGIRVRNYKLETAEGAGNNNVLALYSDSKGVIWAGTAGSGLFRYDKKTDEFSPVNSNNLSRIITSSTYVNAMLEDTYGALWIGTGDGVSILKKQTDELFEYTDLVHGNDPASLSSNMVEVIFEDSMKQLWIGTFDKGLNLYNRQRGTFTVFTIKDGLPSNSIKGILEDDDGQLWVSTNKGICRFDHSTLTITNYTRDDGLNSNEFYVQSCLKAGNGEFFFGGENGFNAFFPEGIKKNTSIPPVYLTDFKINNRSVVIGAKGSPLKKHISETTEIILNYKQSSFSIDFIALNYTRPLRNQFCYKLEGFNEEWICIGNTRSAIYTNIMPGKYIFLVKGSNNDGIWNDTPVQLKIIIKQPYWKTWWAKLFYIVLFLMIVYLYISIRNERIAIKAKLKLEQLSREKEHENNEANIQFFTNISHEFRTPLSLIIAPLESLILSAHAKAKKQLMVIYHNAQRLLHLTNNLMDLRKLEEGRNSLKIKHGEIISFIRDVSLYFKVDFKRRNIQFSINSSTATIDGWFDPEKLETIMLNLLSNASKYTPESGNIRIEINILTSTEVMERYATQNDNELTHSRHIEVSVTDNGPGITTEHLPFIFDKFYQSYPTGKKSKSGTGIGLALTKGFVELNHGYIKASSVPNFETCFSFVLPIDRESFLENEIITEPIDVIGRTIINERRDPVLRKEENESAYSGLNGEIAELLIIEDNFELRSFLAEVLSEKYIVYQAEDEKPGIEIAFEKIPDLIISDILLPEGSGIELCNKLKSDIRTCHIPIILLTAKTAISDQIEGIETGADAYITKPFNIQFLHAQINQLIRSRRELFAHFSQDVYILPHKMTSNEIDQKFLQKTIDYILENIVESSLTVESLADHLGLSRSNVYRKIKALTGKTAIEFIRIVRLKQSIKLMETNLYSLAEIAYLTGFSSPSYFTQSFKDQYGKPPSEYLKT